MHRGEEWQVENRQGGSAPSGAYKGTPKRLSADFSVETLQGVTRYIQRA